MHWELWPSFALRSAGLPVERVRALATSEASRAIDRYVETDARAEGERRRAVDRYREMEKRATDRAAIRKIVKKLIKDGVPETDDPALEPLRGVRAARDRADEAARSLFSEELANARSALRNAVSDPRFREALAWQNRSALELGADKILEKDALDSKARQHERLAVRYLQRYATKNESIGFFGPMAFGSFGDRTELVRGPSFLAERRLFFEYRTIAAFAERLGGDHRVRPFLLPRKRPDVRLEGTRLFYPIEQSGDLDPAIARALAACIGERSARSIGDDESLEELEANGIIFWKIELPTAGIPPEVELRRILEQVEPDDLRAELLEPLSRLEEAKRALAQAAGDATQVLRASRRLEATFTEVTGLETKETLVYEDCRRDVELSLDERIQSRLLRPLELVLASARWFTYEIAEAYRRAFDEIYDRAGETRLDYLRFWREAQKIFTERPMVDAIARELQRRWSEVLDLGGSEPIVRTTGELAARVEERFRAPHPGWPSARHHSPDVLIAARSFADLGAGRFQLVLGELHVGMNTLTNPFMLDFHPDRSALLERRERELPRPSIAPVWSAARRRADFYSPSRHDFDLENGNSKSWRPRDRVVQSGALVVERQDGRLLVKTRDGALSFDIIRFVEQHLIAEAHGRFDPLPRLDHRPRVTIDDLILGRATWRASPADLAFANEDGYERFRGARRWAKALGLPRFCFAKVPEQPKPIYLDLESPHLVDLFASQIRSASEVVISEMLPDPDALWLSDEDGTYTSELRLVTVDPIECPY